MNVLVIGGTQFVGRHVVDAFAARGHHLTLFNRGSNPGVHADIAQIHGDREKDLTLLDGRTWDAVIDCCGYLPGVVEASAHYFRDRAKRYLFISTISVYDHEAAAAPAEDSPVVPFPEDADPAEFSLERYGPLKVLCEQRAQAVFGTNVTIVRPGLVAGPFDPTDRFTYWPVRFDEGGDVVTPLPQRRVQYIDARDLAAFITHLVETETDGIFNAVVPAGSVTFGDLCDACMRESSAEDARTVALSDEFLAEHGVRPWSELPLWIPASSALVSMANANAERARAAGLRVRGVAETVYDTLAWARAAEKRPGGLKAGLDPEKEARLLSEAIPFQGGLDTLR